MFVRRSRSSRCLALLFAFLPAAAFAAFVPRLPEVAPDGSMVGRPTTGDAGVAESVSSIMARQAERGFEQRAPRRSIEHESRRRPVDNPEAPAVSQWPPAAGEPQRGPAALAPQTPSTTFLGATLADTGAFPPDTMGTVGPTQFIVAVNGRIRSFNKTTGVADGVLNVDSDVFFASVLTPGPNFTSDPRIRYDRLSGRWYLVIIDVPNSGTVPNRTLLAVSDTATITGTTVWTFFFFQFDLTTQFADYPTLGIDANALYIGANMFSASAGTFTRTDAAVVRKSSVTSGGPIVVTLFPGLATGTGAGPYTPQGVDNFDPAATEGYFIGVDNAAFSLLQVRRVSTPGGTPTLSGNLSVTVPTTNFPAPAPHLGNTGGTNGRLDTLDDRLFAAHLRDGRLWTAHNIRVGTTGVASTTNARNAARWYELQNLTTTPSLRQSGTVFDSAATNPRHYFIPSVMVSGQGHAAFGFTSAGNTARANAATVGRLVGDSNGTTQGAPVDYTATTFDYNPPSDPGGAGGRRWGDYSYTSLDPCDDMTMWTIQEFTNATNSYGVQAVKLLAPAPTLSCASPTVLPQGNPGTVTVTGTGFYEPSAGIDACRVALAATAAGTGVTVTSVTFNSPTSATLNVSVAPGATTGARGITVTNPDGQTATNTNCLTIAAGFAPEITALDRISTNPVCATGNVSWRATFATPIAGVSPGNFTLGGGTGAAITGVSGNGTVWTVNANSGTAAATLDLTMSNTAGTTPSVTNTPFTGQAYTVNALPTVANVTGGGAFCSGGAGVPVNLSASQSGVDYQLNRDGNPVGAPFAGTGAAIAFGNQTVAGTYTVDASNATTTCAAPMSGNAVVTVDPTPSLDPVTAAPICTGGTTNIALSSTPTGATFAWTSALASGAVTGFAPGTGNTIAQALTGAGVVTYTVAPTLGACAAAGSPVQQTVADPAIVTTQLPNTVLGASYNQALSAPGAITGATFAVTSGALPNGLTLSPAGVVSGTPTVESTFTFTVTATANGIASCSSPRAYTIVVGDLMLRDGFE